MRPPRRDPGRLLSSDRAAPLSVEAVRRRSPWPRRFLGRCRLASRRCASASRARRCGATCSSPPIMSAGSTSSCSAARHRRLSCPRPRSRASPLSAGSPTRTTRVYVDREHAQRASRARPSDLRDALADGRAGRAVSRRHDQRPATPAAVPPSLFAVALPAVAGRAWSSRWCSIMARMRRTSPGIGDEAGQRQCQAHPRAAAAVSASPLRFLEPLDRRGAGDRKALAAQAARAAIARRNAATLGASVGACIAYSAPMKSD